MIQGKFIVPYSINIFYEQVILQKAKKNVLDFINCATSWLIIFLYFQNYGIKESHFISSLKIHHAWILCKTRL
jgi:hypothetical protein